jgi:hypothetical protein
MEEPGVWLWHGGPLWGVGMVRGAEVPSGGGVVVMGMAGVTMFQPREIGKPELPPSLEVELSSLADSSRMACSDGYSL